MIPTFEVGSPSGRIPYPLSKGITTGGMQKSFPFEVASRRVACEGSAWGDEMENVRSSELGIPPRGEISGKCERVMFTRRRDVNLL